MAAKNKQRKKSKKVTFEAEENEPEAKNSEEEREEEELSLEEVLRLGGTKADYILLAGLEDSNELVDGGMKGAIDDLEEGELESFITKLGIRAYATQQTIPDKPEGEAATAATAAGEKKAKNVKVEKAEETAPDTQPNVVDQKQKKTKEVPLSAAKKAKQSQTVFEFQPRQVLLIKPGGKWFELDYTEEGSSAPQDAALVSQYKTLAQQLFEAEVNLYKTKKSLQKGANSAWMKTDRKLRTFAQHPFDQLEEKASGNRDARDRRLILWYFEHQLKHHVAEFVVALDSVAHDTVPATKAKALATAHELLCSRPEQEKALLTQVVNKLGDPEYKTAAKASYLLETLLHKHPNMKGVVCCEVERLLFRPNISPKAQYYAVCFLSQVILSHDEDGLAAKLITIYFSFFRACVKKKDIESKMLSALLAGVNRAYPYTSAGDDKVREQMDTLFKVVHLVKFNTAVQALMLLFQVMDSQQSISDRYYVALYR
uniref:CCAAT enhancer binding protein zeta n=1 Tax=Neolamprologus brichardi TaxID=32507 RepID=A0A3Q4GUR0_NEOBR